MLQAAGHLVTNASGSGSPVGQASVASLCNWPVVMGRRTIL